jgi:hypothetical protein
MREMLLRVFAVTIAATLLLVPAYAQQSHWSSANDKTAKYIIEMERKWAEGVCVDNGVVAACLPMTSKVRQRKVRASRRQMN